MQTRHNKENCLTMEIHSRAKTDCRIKIFLVREKNSIFQKSFFGLQPAEEQPERVFISEKYKETFDVTYTVGKISKYPKLPV